jgi:rubrerythrin
MLRIDPIYLTAVRNAKSAADLHELLQNAVRLEHSAIPPYLTAAYSLKPGTSSPIRGLIAGIVKEEMLHMAIAANVLNAIGGRPRIDSPQFIPAYPGPLPMNIGGFQVGLKKFSKELVHDVFMEIEEPEHPIDFPDAVLAAVAFATIGKSYQAIMDKIQELDDGIFAGGDPGRQVVHGAGFLPTQLFAITNVDTATRALGRVVKDGEGTTALPLDEDGRLAHYYVFEEIYRGKELVKDATAPNGYSYSGAALAFDPASIWDIPDNPKAADYPNGSVERGKVDEFNRAHSDVLRLLQQAFDGTPAMISAAVDSMRNLRLVARDVVSKVDSHTGKQLGLTFEFIPAP